MEIKINIDDYLSEEEKKEIIVDAYRSEVRKGIDMKDEKRRMDNYERIISNSVHYYLSNEIDSMLGTDTKEMIRKNVDKTINNHDYSYALFRKKSAWETEDSPAQAVAKSAVESHRDEMTKRIKEKLNETIDNIDSGVLYEMYTESFDNFISDKLK